MLDCENLDDHSEEQPLVSITFDLGGSIENKVLCIRKTEVTPYDPNSKPDQDYLGIYQYTGRHDHGELPSLNSGGYNSALISGIMCAKKLCDEYLTDAMATREAENQGQGQNNNIDQYHPKKKGKY